VSEHLNSSTIQQYLAEVADELPVDGTQRVVVLVGGALLAWHDLRDATRDVDSGSRLDSEIVAAVARVAGRHGLARKWFNDSAAAFLPATFDRDVCEVLIDSPTLRVLGAPWDQLFLMKLNASRAIDTDDMEVIWPLCSFESAEAAAEAFFEAYPLEQPDEFLADHIRRIV
jgi:hypothetical protein